MTDHNGIPVFLAPTAANGQVLGAITFRVGMADEDFGNHGITHLVEHLAFTGVLNSSVHANGTTSEAYTCFYAVGTADEVVTFLNQVTANLADLPLERMEAEKDILRTEATSRGGVLGRAATVRHGVQGFGLPGIVELGLNRVTADEAASWAARYFTAGNAAIALALPEVPEGLHVNLPPGDLIPAPQVTTNPITIPTPASIGVRANVVAIDAIVERSRAAWVAETLGAKRFFRELREIDALSYNVDVSVKGLSTTHDRFTITADTVSDKAEAVAGALVDTLAALALGRFSDEDFEAAKAEQVKTWSATDIETSSILSNAINYLWGRQTKTPQELLADIEGVTRQDVTRVFQAVRDSALWVGPVASLEWAGIRLVDFTSKPTSGHEFPQIGASGKLVVSDRALSWVGGDGSALTVPFERVAGVAVFPDGGREVVGLDDVTISLEPTLYQGLTGALASALIDSRVPSTKIVPLPMRRPEDIPSPPEVTDEVPAPQAWAQEQYAPSPAYTQTPDYGPAPDPTPWGYPSTPYSDPTIQTYPMEQLIPTQPQMQVMPPQAYPSFPTAQVSYPSQPSSPPAQSWPSQPKGRSSAGLVGWIVLAVIFGMVAAFSALFVIFTAATWSDPNSPTAFWVFLVLLVITGIPTGVFIAMAVRWNKR
ncbi:MAG: hypothetical protein LBN10_05095 [Propionibacteriaceae bacterium]|nr:hypothetical protein [Propionibacteriaceae bacterium]